MDTTTLALEFIHNVLHTAAVVGGLVAYAALVIYCFKRTSSKAKS